MRNTKGKYRRKNKTADIQQFLLTLKFECLDEQSNLKVGLYNEYVKITNRVIWTHKIYEKMSDVQRKWQLIYERAAIIFVALGVQGTLIPTITGVLLPNGPVDRTLVGILAFIGAIFIIINQFINQYIQNERYDLSIYKNKEIAIKLLKIRNKLQHELFLLKSKKEIEFSKYIARKLELEEEFEQIIEKAPVILPRALELAEIDIEENKLEQEYWKVKDKKEDKKEDKDQDNEIKIKSLKLVRWYFIVLSIISGIFIATYSHYSFYAACAMDFTALHNICRGSTSYYGDIARYFITIVTLFSITVAYFSIDLVIMTVKIDEKKEVERILIYRIAKNSLKYSIWSILCLLPIIYFSKYGEDFEKVEVIGTYFLQIFSLILTIGCAIWIRNFEVYLEKTKIKEK